MADPRWLTPDELRAWMRLAAVIEILPGRLDAQLQRDASLTHFEYLVLAKLSEAADTTLRMSDLAAATNATAARLSHVVKRLEARGYIRREACLKDGRATNACLTADGAAKVRASAPGHVELVRSLVLDPLTPTQIGELDAVAGQLLTGLDPDGRMTATPHD